MVEITLSPLHDRAGFVNDWRALTLLTKGQTFFQSPAWIEAWLSIAPKSTALHRIDAHDGGERVLLGAFGKQLRRSMPLIGLRETRFHEFGDAKADAIYVEYNDFLVADRAQQETLREQAAAAIFQEIKDVDAVVFRNLNPAALAAVQKAAAKQSLSCRVLNEQPVYLTDLQALREQNKSYIDGLNASSLRTKIRRSIRLYEERGALKAGIAATHHEKNEAWGKLVDLHERRRRTLGQTGAFSNKVFLSFHQRLMKIAPDHFHFFVVRVGGEIIGVLYNFDYNGRVMSYQSGFHYENDNRLVPGFVCTALSGQYYLEHGYEIYDYLAGGGGYKRRLGSPGDTLTSIAVDFPTWRNKLRKSLKA